MTNDHTTNIQLVQSHRQVKSDFSIPKTGQKFDSTIVTLITFIKVEHSKADHCQEFSSVTEHVHSVYRFYRARVHELEKYILKATFVWIMCGFVDEETN